VNSIDRRRSWSKETSIVIIEERTMDKTYLRTRELAELLGVASSTLANLEEPLKLNGRTGIQGVDGVYDFRAALVSTVYVELSRIMSYSTARRVAQDLGEKWREGDFFSDPVAIILPQGIAWISNSDANEEYLTDLQATEPLAVLYRIPVDRVRNYFEPVPA
jgi:hypothetical protein